jgi:hypothetical protein
VYTLQTYDYDTDTWKTAGTFDTGTDQRAEGNAFDSYNLRRIYGPVRLLKDGVRILGVDNPDDHYTADL